jgi:tetratricopeptide (TPR) repeat protein
MYEKALKQTNNSIAIAESEHDDKRLSKIQELQGEIWNSLAYAYAERGEHLSIAESYIERALKRKPNEPNYLDTNAWVSIRRTELSDTLSKDQREARLLSADQLLKKAIDLLPADAVDTRAETIFHLGYIERLRGRDDAAQRLFLEALEVNPELQNAKEALRR